MKTNIKPRSNFIGNFFFRLRKTAGKNFSFAYSISGITSLIISASLSAQPALNWVDNIGTTIGFPGIFSQSIAADNSGNTIIAGGFQGTFDFDPGPDRKSVV